MSKKIKYWLDSGANIHSCRKDEITLDELGYTEDQWDALSSKEQEEIIKPYAFENSDWGFCKEGEE